MTWARPPRDRRATKREGLLKSQKKKTLPSIPENAWWQTCALRAVGVGTVQDRREGCAGDLGDDSVRVF